MNIDSLRNFAAIAEAGSITKAAQDLYISAQGLNKMVTAMEDELGYKLVARTKRGITLTLSGEVFLRHARKLLKDYDAMLDELATSDRDIGLMMSCPFKIAATALCIERVVQPLRSVGSLGDVTLREVALDNALAVSAEDGWLALVDVPTYVEPRPESLDGSSLVLLAKARMGIVYDKNSFPNIPKNPSSRDVSQLPLGIIDAPTMKAYADLAFGPEVVSEQTRYLTRQFSLLADAAANGRAVMLYDSLSWSQVRNSAPNMAFAQIDDHECKLGFIHYADADDSAKREYVDAFQRVFRTAARRNGWALS